MRTGPQDQILDDIIESLECGEFKTVLNVGSGDGVLSKKLQMAGYKVTNLEVRKIDGEYILLFDGKNIPFPDRTFDVTICIYVLHHAKYQERLIEEIARVSRGGILIAEDTPKNRLEMLISKVHALIAYLRGWSTFCMFRSESEWKGLVEKNEATFVHAKQLKKWWGYPVSHTLLMFKKNDWD